MIGKLIPKTWTSPAGRVLRPEDVDRALDRLDALEALVAELMADKIETEDRKSPDYWG